jgi:polyferredoxin
MGVDIRKGLQLGCIQCGLCIDACDTVMKKIHRPIRLISYDTDENIKRRERGEKAVYKLIRPRTIFYAVVIAAVGSLMLYKLTTRQNLGLSVLHVRAPMYTATPNDAVRNGYTLRFANKWGEPHHYALTVDGVAGASIKSEEADKLPDGRLEVDVDPDATAEVQLYVTAPRSSASAAGVAIVMTATDLQSGETVSVADHFFGP